MPQTAALLLRTDSPDRALVRGGPSRGEPEAARVVRILRSTEFRVVACASWRGFRRRAAAAHVAVVVAPRLDPDDAASGLRETAREEFPCPLVLVTGGEPGNLCRLASIRVARVVLLPEVERLPEILRTLATNDGRLLLRAAIRRREMHPTLKRALCALVELPQSERAPTTRSEARFPRTVDDLARRVSRSGSHLRRLGVQARLPLGTIVRRHVGLRALEMLAAGVHADTVADRFGYESASGLHALIERHFRSRAPRLLRSGIQPLYVATARLVDPDIEIYGMSCEGMK